MTSEERLLLIKNLALKRFQPKPKKPRVAKPKCARLVRIPKVHVPRPPKLNLSPEEWRKRKTELNNAKRIMRQSQGCCSRCDDRAVLVQYVFRGVVLISYQAKFCPRHWEAPTIKKELNDSLAAKSAHSDVILVPHGVPSHAGIAG